MKIYPKVFVIVLNYNGKDFIKNCLASLFKTDYPNFEIIVVDNDSKDGSLELAKNNFSKATFIKNPKNLGFARGNNVGIRFALERAADYVLIINNDTEVEEGFLGKLVEVAEKEKEIGIVSPVIFKSYTGEAWFLGGKINWLKMRVEHVQEKKMEEYYPSEFVSGCCLLIKQEVFRKVGLFDEDFFLYYEDADFGWRASQAGFKKMVVAGSWVYHFEKSEKAKNEKLYWLVLSGLMFFGKNASFFRKIWINFYLSVRRIKNRLDLFFRRNSESAKVIKRAFDDYKNNGK